MISQQLILSGVGGQGILFITRLLAETAIAKGLPVMTSETHGMAQRGGIVISHLKVGSFSSPLVQPGRAAGLIEPVVIRGVAGWRPSSLAYGVRHEIFVFESRLSALLTSNTLPSKHPGGALILARANDGAALVARHNYAWPPRAPAAGEMMEAA